MKKKISNLRKSDYMGIVIRKPREPEARRMFEELGNKPMEK